MDCSLLSDDHGSTKAGRERAKWDTKRVVAYTKSKCRVAHCIEKRDKNYREMRFNTNLKPPVMMVSG